MTPTATVQNARVLFHLYLFERYENQQGRGNLGRGYFFTNLSEEQLQTRIVERWNRGEAMTWNGRTVDAMRVGNIAVFQSERTAPDVVANIDELREISEEVTNHWVLGPAGSLRVEATAGSESTSPDPRRVMVIHGRNTRARDAMFNFLRAVGLAQTSKQYVRRWAQPRRS